MQSENYDKTEWKQKQCNCRDVSNKLEGLRIGLVDGSRKKVCEVGSVREQSHCFTNLCYFYTAALNIANKVKCEFRE